MKSKTPISIILISIYFWLISFIYGFVGFGIILNPRISINNEPFINLTMTSALLFCGVFIFIALIFLLIGIGLFKRNKLSKWLAILVSGTTVFFAVLGAINNSSFPIILATLVNFIINGTIIYFLLFSRVSKKVF